MQNTYCSFRDEFLKDLRPYDFASILKATPYGFVRFDNDKINSCYIAVVFKDYCSGFIKYKTKDEKFYPHSFYVTLDGALENRYDLEGKLICRYITEVKDNKPEISKFVDGKFKEKHCIDRDKIKNFPDYFEMIKNIINKDNDKFRYFNKGENITYLFIEDYCRCKEPQLTGYRTVSFCNKCQKATN